MIVVPMSGICARRCGQVIYMATALLRSRDPDEVSALRKAQRRRRFAQGGEPRKLN